MFSNLWVSALFVLSTAAANVLQKKGMAAAGPVNALSLEMIGRLIREPAIWAGLGAYALALGTYLVLLSRVPLNVATSIAALNFVAVLLASRLVLGESIPAVRYAGFAFIFVGLFIVTRTL
jgi:drug/metabolite transporter (DMT)-like permease